MAESSGYTRIYRNGENPVPAWIPHEYVLKNAQAANGLPTDGVPAGSQAYTADMSVLMIFDGEQWTDVGGGE